MSPAASFRRLVHGDDDWRIQRECRRILEEWERGHPRFDTEIVDGQDGDWDASLGAFLSAVSTPSLFAPGKIVWWRNCPLSSPPASRGKAGPKEKDDLVRRLEGADPARTLVLISLLPAGPAPAALQGSGRPARGDRVPLAGVPGQAGTAAGRRLGPRAGPGPGQVHGGGRGRAAGRVDRPGLAPAGERMREGGPARRRGRGGLQAGRRGHRVALAPAAGLRLPGRGRPARPRPGAGPPGGRALRHEGRQPEERDRAPLLALPDASA